MIYPHEVKPEGHQRGIPSTTWPPSARGSRPNAVDNYLYNRGLNPGVAYEAGWYAGIVDGEVRLVIPCLSTDSTLRFWQARSIDGSEPRYKSASGPRGDALVYMSGDRGLVSVVCEGPMDALAMMTFDVKCAIALMGNTPSEAGLRHAVKRLKEAAVPVVILADADAIAEASVWAVKFASAGLYTRLVLPKAGYKDVADMPYKERCKLWRNLIAHLNF